MSEQAIARRLLDKCARRLSGEEMQLCESIAIGSTSFDEMPNHERRLWASLNTEFASELYALTEPDRDFSETSTPSLL